MEKINEYINVHGEVLAFFKDTKGKLHWKHDDINDEYHKLDIPTMCKINFSEDEQQVFIDTIQEESRRIKDKF